MDWLLFKENFTLTSENPLKFDPDIPATEAEAANTKLKNLNMIYTQMRAINSNKVTRNNTLYPSKTLIGKKSVLNSTGYASFVQPFGKPVITEHNLSGGFFSDADKPMGRILYACYQKHKPEMIMDAMKGYPGYHEGDGAMRFVCGISDPEAIPKVLGGAYNTVSISSKIEKVIESISGSDLRSLAMQGKELPPFQRGKWYEVDGEMRLSWWSMEGGMEGYEVSYVNMPSDTHAFNEDPDIGETSFRALIGEKKVGMKEFTFYDALSTEKLFELSAEEYSAYDPNLELIDSIKLPEYYSFDWKADNEKVETPVEPVGATNESVTTPETEKAKKPVSKKKLKYLGSVLCTVLGEKEDCSFVRAENSVKILTVTTERLTDEPVEISEKVSALKNLEILTESFGVPYLPIFTEEDVKSLDINELKEYFNTNFIPNKRFKLESCLKEPLLKLRSTENWNIADVELAWNFKQIAMSNTDSEVLAEWGIKEKKLSKLAQIIKDTI